MLIGALWLASSAMAQAPLVLEADGRYSLDWESLPLEDIRLHDELDVDAIVNGEETTAYPGVVALAGMSNWGGYVFCSGTLIDPEYILTAAHCVVEIPSMEQQGMTVTVLFGGNLGRGADDAIEISDWRAHPDYSDSQLRNDIGLLKLSTPKNGVDLAVLNDEAPDSSWVGQDMSFVGFGITSDNADDSGVKRTTDIAVSSWDDQFIHSFTSGTNLCSGDSGGAAFENTGQGTQELAGVNSWVSPGCVGGSNGVTRVDQHIAWIQEAAPNVLLGGDGSGSNPGGGGGGGGGGSVGQGDPDNFDRELPAPVTPDKGDYPVGVGCDIAGRPVSGIASVMILGLLGLRRRRDA